MDSYKFAERVFLLMPLMHSEILVDVELCLKEATRQVQMAEEEDNKDMKF